MSKLSVVRTTDGWTDRQTDILVKQWKQQGINEGLLKRIECKQNKHLINDNSLM